jgi:hypothetical protein
LRLYALFIALGTARCFLQGLLFLISALLLALAGIFVFYFLDLIGTLGLALSFVDGDLLPSQLSHGHSLARTNIFQTGIDQKASVAGGFFSLEAGFEPGPFSRYLSLFRVTPGRWQFGRRLRQSRTSSQGAQQEQ